MDGLAGKRILVVEDEYYTAADLKRGLEAAAALVLGPIAGLDDGLSLASEAEIDAAILDVNLEGRTSCPIAERLAERHVPFLVLTGYDDWMLPRAHRAAPHMVKPFRIATVLGQVAALAGGDGGPR